MNGAFTFTPYQSGNAAYWQCVCINEYLYHSGDITTEDYLNELEICQSGYTAKTDFVEVERSSILKQDVSQDLIKSIFPNPSDGYAVIELAEGLKNVTAGSDPMPLSRS